MARGKQTQPAEDYAAAMLVETWELRRADPSSFEQALNRAAETVRFAVGDCFAGPLSSSFISTCRVLEDQAGRLAASVDAGPFARLPEASGLLAEMQRAQTYLDTVVCPLERRAERRLAAEKQKQKERAAARREKESAVLCADGPVLTEIQRLRDADYIAFPEPKPISQLRKN